MSYFLNLWIVLLFVNAIFSSVSIHDRTLQKIFEVSACYMTDKIVNIYRFKI